MSFERLKEFRNLLAKVCQVELGPSSRVGGDTLLFG